MFKSVISTPSTQCLVIDIKDFYLNTHMERYENMRIPLNLIPQAIIDQYNLLSIAHNGHVLVKIRKECTDCHKLDALPTTLLSST
jgi:hypothetical protein